MAIVQKKRIVWYSAKKKMQGVSMDITEASRVRDDEAIKSKSDSFSFAIFNHMITSVHTTNANLLNKYMSNVIDINDRITIEYANDTDDFVMVFIGDIDNIKESDNIDENTITIKGVNRTEKLLNSIENVGSIGTSTTADVLVETLVSRVNDKSDKTKIAGGRWNTQLSATSFSGAGQTWNSGSGLTTSIGTGFKGADNGNITITVYKTTSTGTFINGLSSITLTLTGTDVNGVVITDTVQISADDKTVASTKNFETITSVTYVNTGETISNHQIVIGTGGVRTVVSDYSTALSTITYHRVGKPVSEYIDELSSEVWTGDVAFLGFVDSNNVLTWKAKSKTSSNTIAKGLVPALGTEGTDYHSAIGLDVERGTFDVITAIRAHLGEDDAGASISTFGFDATAVAKHGWKWSYEDFSEISNQIIEVDDDRDGNGPGLTTAQIRTEAKAQGKERIRAILKVTGYARYKVKAKFIFNSRFTKGTMIKVVNEKRGWTASSPYKLRISEISQECTTMGIFTHLELIEDEEEASINVKNLKEYENA